MFDIGETSMSYEIYDYPEEYADYIWQDAPNQLGNYYSSRGYEIQRSKPRPLAFVENYGPVTKRDVDDAFAKKLEEYYKNSHPAPVVTPAFLAPEPMSPFFYEHVPSAADVAFMERFPDIVGDIELTDVLVQPDGAKIPRNIGDYSLVPVTTTLTDSPSRVSTGSACTAPPGVKFNYGSFGGRPFLDSSVAIGLVYQGELSAVASACLDEDDTLRIVQIQGVTAKASNPATRYQSGLHSNFQWRDTLVQAWLSVAEALGVATVEVQGAANNRWVNPIRKLSFEKGYDKVAERLGFAYDPSTRNWALAMLPAAFEVDAPPDHTVKQ